MEHNIYIYIYIYIIDYKLTEFVNTLEIEYVPQYRVLDLF